MSRIGKIYQEKTKDGNLLYPQTVSEAVIDAETGQNVKRVLENIKDAAGLGENYDWTPVAGGDSIREDLENLSSEKVDKVSGKVLSDNNYTTAEKSKVGNLPENTILELSGKQGILTPGAGIDMTGGIISSPRLIPVTYSELKTLKNNSQLIPGQFYRITDYTCTTSQEGTRSANHPFDIIVQADSESILNENAHAALHSGDTYFAAHPYPIPEIAVYLEYHECDLSAWELKYCLDNDADRFTWADPDNGKGVIYYMKDEWDNECPYDFKNIQFKRYKITSVNGSTEHELVGTYGLSTDTVEVDEDDYIWCYTFNGMPDEEQAITDVYDFSAINPSVTDAVKSMFGVTNIGRLNECFLNVIKETYNAPKDSDYDKALIMKLNNIVFLCLANNMITASAPFIKIGRCMGNTFNLYCDSITFGHSCDSNTFGHSCDSNTFGNSCYFNTFGNKCSSNTFGRGCFSNIFGNNCYSNTFDNFCCHNIFGNICIINTFGNGCNYNIFGNDCNYNTFDYDYSSNIFGNSCDYNTFGNSCKFNTLGNNCNDNTLGNECSSNTFGDGCSYNTFGSSASSTKDFYQYITYENGVRYTILDCTAMTSGIALCQNVHVNSGVKGSSNTSLKTLTVATANNNFTTEFGIDSTGKLTSWNPADLPDLISAISQIDLVTAAALTNLNSRIGDINQN